MKKIAALVVALLLLVTGMPIMKRAYAASCPTGTGVVCIQFSTFWNTFTYVVTGGTTARTDLARWVDDYISIPETGVDCTGATDSTTAVQAQANLMLWNKSVHVSLPNGCQVKISSTITVTDASGPIWSSQSFAGDGTGTPATFVWAGTNGGGSCNIASNATFAPCVYMFDIEHTDHPVFENLAFVAPGGSNCPDGFIKFDGEPGAHNIGTNGRVKGSSFSNGNCNNSNYIGVNISQTALNNHENYVIEDSYFSCGSSLAAIYGHAATTNGTATVTDTTDHPFSAGDVGKRIRLSYSLGIVDTTIASYTSTSVVVMSAPTWSSTTVYPMGALVTGSDTNLYVAIREGQLNKQPVGGGGAGYWIPMWTQSNVGVAVGTSNGIGIRTGGSQNNIQHIFSHIQYSRCAYGIQMQGGNAQIIQPSGGYSDIGIYIGGFVAQNMLIDFYASENDLQAIVLGAGRTSPITISNSRFSNGNQLSNGHVMLQGQVLFSSNLFNFAMPTNAVLMGLTEGQNNTFLVSSNNFYNQTYANTGLGSISGASNALLSFNDGLVSPGTGIHSYLNSIIQTKNDFLYSAAGTALPTCNTAAKGIEAMVSDATTPTYLGTYASGGAVVSKVLCNGTNWVTN